MTKRVGVAQKKRPVKPRLLRLDKVNPTLGDKAPILGAGNKTVPQIFTARFLAYFRGSVRFKDRKRRVRDRAFLKDRLDPVIARELFDGFGDVLFLKFTLAGLLDQNDTGFFAGRAVDLIIRGGRKREPLRRSEE